MSNLIIRDVGTFEIHEPVESQLVFSFDFAIRKASELEVYLDGVPTSDYVLDGISNVDGGSVTFTLPPEADGVQQVLIQRVMEIIREVDLPDTGPYDPNDVDIEFDRVFAILQEHRDALDRAILMPIGEEGFTFPSAAERANKFIYFDSEGGWNLITLAELKLLLETGDGTALETLQDLIDRVTALEAYPQWGYRYGGYAEQPQDNAILFDYQTTIAHTLPADLVDAYEVGVDANPSDGPYIITLTNGVTTIGTITIATDGSVTALTTGGLDIAIAADTNVRATLPVSDSTLAGLRLTMVGQPDLA